MSPERFFLQNLPLPIATALPALLEAPACPLQLERESSSEIKLRCQMGKAASGEPWPAPSTPGRRAASLPDHIAQQTICSLTGRPQRTKRQPYGCPALLLPPLKVPVSYNEN